MTALLTAVALWCGQPYKLGDVLYSTAANVNACRSRMLDCVAAGAANKLSADKALEDCAKKEQLKP